MAINVTSFTESLEFSSFQVECSVFVFIYLMIYPASVSMTSYIACQSPSSVCFCICIISSLHCCLLGDVILLFHTHARAHTHSHTRTHTLTHTHTHAHIHIL